MPDSSQASGSAARGWALVAFFVMAFLLMWACFFTVAFAPIPANTLLGRILILLGAFAPALAALATTLITEGRCGVRGLLGKVTRWREPAKYYVFALGFMIAIKLTAALIHRAATGAWPRFGHETLILIPVAIAFSTPFQIGEELGWRGYALPGMAARLGFPGASLLLGLIWGAWHLPQFFIREGDSYHQSFPVFVLGTTALSVAFAWLYVRTGGSVPLTMLLHAAINNSKDIVPSGVAGGTETFGFHASFVSWVTLAVLWVSAACFLLDMSKKKGNIELTAPD